ncbi:hypothetical protein GH714_029196 [Hevea brasiliensis]|uniref:Chromo domain-containing protein n=1 Tax=Hevea brasiliensis TaxID=3981 RepID=A0A6A6KMC9_HEVBR|nr:hypothetical protein GH714_029196 [Hevea brasiliensis]
MELASGKGSDGSASSQNVSSHKIRQSWGNSTKLEFPRFSGEGLEGWLLRVDYFFEVANVAADDRVKMAALHLEDLRNLKQVSSLQDYLDAFDEIYPKAGIREDQALSFFLSGLVDELQMPVRMFKPSTLAEAYSLARLQEITVAAIQNKPKPSVKPASYNYLPLSRITTQIQTHKPTITTTSSSREQSGLLPLPSLPKPPAVPAKNSKITDKDMDERRAKGLCFWCEEKYTPAHKCKKKQAYVMQLITEENEEDEENEDKGVEGEMASDMQLSLNAMWGTQGTQIMRIKGECGKRILHVLVDTGSTHNFLSTKMASKLKCELQKAAGISVEVANGQQLQCEGFCKNFTWSMQGETKKKLSKELNSLMTCLNDDGLFHVDGREATAYLYSVASQQEQVDPTLPPVSHIQDAYPQAILDRRMVKRHNAAATQLLIHWRGLSPADASWEYADELQARFPTFLEDKESDGRGS